MEGIRRGTYPPRLHSTLFATEPEEMLEYWETVVESRRAAESRSSGSIEQVDVISIAIPPGADVAASKNRLAEECDALLREASFSMLGSPANLSESLEWIRKAIPFCDDTQQVASEFAAVVKRDPSLCADGEGIVGQLVKRHAPGQVMGLERAFFVCPQSGSYHDAVRLTVDEVMRKVNWSRPIQRVLLIEIGYLDVYDWAEVQESRIAPLIRATLLVCQSPELQKSLTSMAHSAEDGALGVYGGLIGEWKEILHDTGDHGMAECLHHVVLRAEELVETIPVGRREHVESWLREFKEGLNYSCEPGLN